MAAEAHDLLRERARRAYEVGRVQHGLGIALWVLPMVALSLFVCRRPLLTLVAGALLYALVAAFGARGQAYGRALRPGLLAGSVPLLLPLLMRMGGHACIGGACWSLCMIGCIAGGTLAGAAIGIASAAQREERGTFIAVASVVAGLAGVLGCAIAGAAGIGGMVLGLALAPLPVVMVARRTGA